MALFRGRLVQRVSRFMEEYHDFGWKYGDLHHYYNGSFFTQISNIDSERMETNTYDVVSHSVGQCTCLVIKGQDLYEGDIIKYSQHKGYDLPDFTAHVVYIKEFACFGYFRHDLKRAIPFAIHDELQTDFLDYCEIIGNAYENNNMISNFASESSDPNTVLAPVFWGGFIEDLDEDEILCILHKDFNLDKKLTMGRGLLTEQQNKMVCKGLVIRYDLANNKIEFMLSDGKNWC